ncbi:MAG: MFS transporter [Opitutaceae bacterium]
MNLSTARASKSLLTAYPRFGLFWLARASSSLAFQMQGVAVGWQIYALTHSTFELGLVGLAEFLPMVLCTLPAGHAADRLDRRTISAISFAAQGAAMAVLALGSADGWLTPADIFGMIAIIGASRAFGRPASQALLPSLVPAEIFPTAIAWSATVFEMAAIAGPALGGLLYAWSPAGGYFIASALAFAAALLFSLIRPEPAAGERPAPTASSLFSGIGYIRRNPVILGSISLDLFAVLLGGATALLPAYARDILKTGAWGLGALRSAPAVGSLAMSVFLTYRPLRRRVGRKMFGAVTVFGLATIVFGLSRDFALSMVALAVLGAADMISVILRSSLVQLQTPDELRGRVSAVNGLFIGTSNQLGEFESGITASWLGIVPATVLGGVGTVLMVFIWMRLFPPLAAFDRLEAVGAPSAEPDPAS